MPSNLDFDEASTLPCAAVTAWNALMEGPERAVPGETVLVLGTGGVSIFAAQLALAAGLRVIATSSSRDKLARLRELGIQESIDYRATPEWQQEVLGRTSGVGVDRVIEVGGAGTLPRALEAVKIGGTVSLIGVLSELGGTIDPFPILIKNIQLRGMTVGSVAMFEAMNRTFETRGIKPVIDEAFAFEDAPAALAKLESGSHFGKIVVRIP